MLKTPVAASELGGEPIEQFRVRGSFALDSEVAGCRDEGASEKLAPVTIDDDSRG